MANDKRDESENLEQKVDIPGYKVFYGAEGKILQEMTRFTDLEVYVFAAKQTKNELTKTKRTKTVGEIYLENVMRNKISSPGEEGKGGAGREDLLALLEIQKLQNETAKKEDYYV